MDLFGEFNRAMETHKQDRHQFRSHSDLNYATIEVWQIWTQMDYQNHTSFNMRDLRYIARIRLVWLFLLNRDAGVLSRSANSFQPQPESKSNFRFILAIAK